MRKREERLILEHLWLVRQIARRLARRSGGDIEEFEADGMIGLIEAAQRYDPEKNNNFAAYAHLRISGAIKDAYRASDRSRKVTGGFHAKRQDVDGQAAWDKLISQSGDQIAALEKKYLRAMLNILPRKLMQLMQMYYLEQKTHLEIGKVFGVSNSRICQMHKEALELIRAHLKKNEYFMV